jgi:hypothetical protein
LETKKSPAKVVRLRRATRKEEIHPTDTDRVTKLFKENSYRRPPPRELPLLRDPLLAAPLDAPRLELEDEPEGEPLDELPRLCTTDGLIRTPCDLFPVATVPAVELLEDAPALLPLNRCQPPALDGDVDDAAVDTAVEPVDAAGRRLTADVLPEDDEVGLTRCQLLLLPEEPEVEPVL